MAELRPNHSSGLLVDRCSALVWVHRSLLPGLKAHRSGLGTIVFLYGGLVFIRGAWNEIADRKPGMMTLISLGITVAFATSLAGTFGLLNIEVWWELATLTTVMILGHWLEMRAVSQARRALSALAGLLPDSAERVIGQATQTVPLSELQVGDIVLVRPGAGFRQMAQSLKALRRSTSR